MICLDHHLSKSASNFGLSAFRRNPQVQGFFFISINSLLLAVSGIIFEFSRLNGTQMSFCTGFVGTCMGSAVFTLFNPKLPVLNKFFGMAILNGILFGGGVIFFIYLSMDYVGPASTTVVQIFTSIVASLFVEKFKLRKAPHLLSILAVLIGFSGMIFLCQTDAFTIENMNKKYFLGVTYAFIAGLFCVVFFSNIKVLSQKNHIPDSWHWISYMVGCALPCVPMLYKYRSLASCVMSVKTTGLLAGFSQSICALMAIKGFMLIKASAAFVFQLMASVLAFLLQVVFLPELVTLFTSIGALLIVSAITLQFIVITKFDKNL